jgi:pimeloyl-ACP methyl ester carboxylesterase
VTALEPQFFTTPDGFRHAFFDLGTGSANPPIILQHGFTASTRTEWVECGIAAALAGLGRRVIGVDALGHGLSDKPHDPVHYGESRMARDIAAIATHLGFEAFDMVGYSMGAVISLLLAVEDRRVRRLAVGGIGEAAVLLGGVDTRAIDGRVLAAAMLADDPETLPEMGRMFRQMAASLGNDLKAVGAHASNMNTATIPLARISAPTLVLAGADDPLAVRPQVLVDAIGGASLALVPGDHTGARLSPEFTAALVDFLR